MVRCVFVKRLLLEPTSSLRYANNWGLAASIVQRIRHRCQHRGTGMGKFSMRFPTTNKLQSCSAPGMFGVGASRSSALPTASNCLQLDSATATVLAAHLCKADDFFQLCGVILLESFVLVLQLLQSVIKSERHGRYVQQRWSGSLWPALGNSADGLFRSDTLLLWISKH